MRLLLRALCRWLIARGYGPTVDVGEAVTFRVGQHVSELNMTWRADDGQVWRALWRPVTEPPEE